jgi:tRNA(Ile2) C34 agmatinyltransferase TiaS
MNYQKFKEIQKFNADNCNKKCPDCGENLTPQYYGYNCLSCGLLLTPELKHAKIEDLI